MSSELDLPVLLKSHQIKVSSTKSSRGKQLITHLQHVLVCESTELKAPQLCSITKTCLCLMLFVYRTQTIAFHGLQVYSPPSRDNVERIQTPLAREQSCESVVHTGGRVGELGQMATGLVQLYECSTSTQAKDASWDLYKTRKEQWESALTRFCLLHCQTCTRENSRGAFIRCCTFNLDATKKRRINTTKYLLCAFPHIRYFPLIAVGTMHYSS